MIPSNILKALTKRNKQIIVKIVENDFVLIVNSLIEKIKLFIERFFSKIIVKKKAPKKCPKSKVAFESGLRSHGKVKGFEDQLRRPDREGTAS